MTFNKKRLLWSLAGLVLFGVALILIYRFTEDPKYNLYALFGLLVYLLIPFWIDKEQKPIWKIAFAVLMIAVFVFLWRLPTWEERMKELLEHFYFYRL